MRSRRPSSHVVLLFSLGLAWINFLFTTKWAHLAGALNGGKRPWFGLALLAVTILAIRSRHIGRRISLPALRLVIVAASLFVAFVFFSDLPLRSWASIPFLDDWPPRFQATLEGVRLLGRGAATGWQWNLLGGYQTSADVSQSLSVIGALPIMIFGGPIGYHVLHLGMFVAIPTLVYLDLAGDEPRDTARLAAVFTLISEAAFSVSVIRSGDTNSIAGVLCAVIALTGSRRAQRGSRWGGPLMALGLTLALYTHAAFFLYTSAYLVLEAIFYRDRRVFVRFVIAAITAFLAALPQYWELLRYPGFFLTNNVIYAPGPVAWLPVARQVYYNFEMLLFPHRWFNDYIGLTNVCLAIIAWVAVKARSRRCGFYACCALLTVGLSGFDVVQLGGYLLSREIHMLAVFTPAALAWFVVEQAGTRTLAWAFTLLVGLYMAVNTSPIPHVASLRDYDAALIDHLQTLDGPLVVLEGNPHRDLIVDESAKPEPTPFGIHFDSMIAAATNRRYYAQTWDGFHWTPLRGQTIAGGAFRGKRLAEFSTDEFVAEMRKWGVRHLVVWSEATKAYLDAAPEQFDRRWSGRRWAAYEMRDPDLRDVVVAAGTGQLRDLDPLGGTVALAGVRAGEVVVVRTNYFPAWTARAGSRVVPLRSVDGQLAFDAPSDGTYDVALEYPKRTGLILLSILAFAAGGGVLGRLTSPKRR